VARLLIDLSDAGAVLYATRTKVETFTEP